MGPFHTTINTKGEKQNAKFLIPGKKTSPDITILLGIKIMLNVFSIGNTFVFLPLCATLEDINQWRRIVGGRVPM